MANRKIQRNKRQATHATIEVGSLWLAGVGAASLARKHGKSVLVDLVGEGRRLQIEAARAVRETRIDLRAQVTGLLKPIKARLVRRIEKSRTAVRSGVTGVLSALGIPSKSDIEDLAQRVGTLSRQLKSAK